MLINARDIADGVQKVIVKHRIFITMREIVISLGAILRGTVTGFILGVMPGVGAGVASFLSYSIETKVARDASKFGHGDIRGVAAPEASNNASSVGALVPMLTLGVPGSGTAAILLVALAALDVQPGPLLFTQRPDVVWGLIAALYLGNVMLLILNLPMVGLFVKLLYIPMRLLLPLILVVSVIGVYSANQATLDLVLLCGFGVLGFYMRKYGFSLPPVILGVVLGNRFEEALRQSMIMTQGNLLALLERPIVLTFVVLTLLSLAGPALLRRLRFRGRSIRLEQEQS